MIVFFYSLYLALMTGTWNTYSLMDFRTQSSQVLNEIATWLMNVFGGDFQAVQTYTFTASTIQISAVIMSIVTIFVIFGAVFGVLKKIFSIFFAGVR